jgi:hypothetical protein
MEQEVIPSELEKRINPPQNFCVEFKPTWREKVGFKLFPSKHVEAPTPKWKELSGDCLVIGTVSVLSWADRLRVLISGRVHTHSKTITQYSIGMNVTAAETFIEPPAWLTGKPKEIEAK